MAVMTIPFQFTLLLWLYESRYADDLEVRVAVHTGPPTSSYLEYMCNLQQMQYFVNFSRKTICLKMW
jgi:hypothetical protein